MIKQLLTSVIAKYRDLLVSRRSIICLRAFAHHWQITIIWSTSFNNCQLLTRNMYTWWWSEQHSWNFTLLLALLAWTAVHLVTRDQNSYERATTSKFDLQKISLIKTWRSYCWNNMPATNMRPNNGTLIGDAKYTEQRSFSLQSLI